MIGVRLKEPSKQTNGWFASYSFFAWFSLVLFSCSFYFLMISSYSFLLLDDPPGTRAMAPCIEAVLIYFVGHISRLDGPVCRPLVYASGGSSPSGLLNFVGSSETKIVSEGFEQRKLTARKSWFDQNDFGSAGVDSFRSKNSHITMTTS